MCGRLSLRRPRPATHSPRLPSRFRQDLTHRYDPRARGGKVVDIVDPHTTSLSDAWPKAIGLAEYADKHEHDYGRIELVIVDNGELRRLDLTDSDTLSKVSSVSGQNDGGDSHQAS